MTTAKKAAGTKAPAKKAGAGKAAGAAGKTAAAKAAGAKKQPAKKTEKKQPGKKQPAKKQPAKKSAAKAGSAAKKQTAKGAAGTAGSGKAGAGKKTATASLSKGGKDPKGGLTAEGRRYFKQKEGLNLRPGVKGKADTPEKMMRKGSFLRRHYANPPGPVVDKKGQPTRQALQAAAWGEPVPKNEADERELAAKGTELLERYHEEKGDRPKGGTGKRSAKGRKKG